MQILPGSWYNVNMKKSGWLLAAVFAAGCASLEEFEGMNPEERAEYVCERHVEVQKLEERLADTEGNIGETEYAISRGYRLRQVCSEESYIRETSETCETDEDGKKTCKTVSKPARQQVCKDVPIPLDGALEQRKLDEYHKTAERLDELADEAYARCYEEVYPMSAEEAFDYHESTRGGFFLNAGN